MVGEKRVDAAAHKQHVVDFVTGICDERLAAAFMFEATDAVTEGSEV